MTATNNTPLTIQDAKVGLRVILLNDAVTEPGATRGRIVTNKDGWVGVRFDDGVTRMHRAKMLARDTTAIVEFKVPPPAKPAPKVEPKPEALDVAAVPGAAKPSKAERIAAAKAKVEANVRARANGQPSTKAAKVKASATPRKAKVQEPGAPCLCGCGELAKSGRSFLQGHDARFHGWMKRLADGRMKPSDPAIPRSALKLMTIVDGCPTTDYDGSPWKP